MAGNLEPLLLTREVAEHLRVKPMTVRKWCRRGKLPGIRVGGQWRIRMTDLERLWVQRELNRQLQGKPS
jgi:excisionase family DNA binding protein